MSCLNKCLPGSNLYLAFGATFDILRKAKKEFKKMALYRTESSRTSHALEMSARVVRSEVPKSGSKVNIHTSEERENQMMVKGGRVPIIFTATSLK